MADDKPKAVNSVVTPNKTFGRLIVKTSPGPAAAPAARPGLDGEIDQRYGDKYDRGQHIADEWNSDKPVMEKAGRLFHALDYTVPDAEAKRQAFIDAANAENARWATVDAARNSPLAAVLIGAGNAAGASKETIDKLAQSGQVIGGIVGSGAAARAGVNPIAPQYRGAPTQPRAPRTPVGQRPAPKPTWVSPGNGIHVVKKPPPGFSKQQQANHVKGEPGYKNRVKQGKGTSAFESKADAERYTQEAWEKGTEVPGRPNVKDYDFGHPVGTGPNGGTQNIVRVHQNAGGLIHGHPKGPEGPPL